MSDGNKITVYSFDKPTIPGLYLIMRGDIEVLENAGLIHLGSDLKYYDEEERRHFHINDIHSDFKFARLVIGSEARKQL